jgi:dihydrolipoamide dehydrogenase
VAQETQYDIVVVGAGPGGYTAAIRASQLGLKCAIVEKWKTLGGTCLNIGCIPSKALLDSSEFYAKMQNEAKDHGFTIDKVDVDIAAMLKRKNKVVKRLTTGVAGLMKKNKIDVYKGTGSIPEAHLVEVAGDEGTEKLKAKNIIIATGSVPTELPFLPFDGEKVVSSEHALDFHEIPKKLLVVGAGIIGLEMASVWSRLGSEVTLVELLPEALAGWDRQTAKAAQKEFGKQGMEFAFETKVNGMESTKSGVKLTAEDKDGKEITFEGDKILVAVGRSPYTEGLGLDKAGVKMAENGKQVEIDENFRTNVEGVYAIGDVVRGAMLAHKAEEEGVAVAEIIAGRKGHVNYDAIPNVVYTWPEVAAVGKTEEQLKEEGIPYKSGQFPFQANGRALAMDATFGFVKILAHEETDRVLGAHIVGPWASDLIAEAVSVIEFGGSAEDIARTSHAHPTLPEAFREAALAVDNRTLNM